MAENTGLEGRVSGEMTPAQVKAEKKRLKAEKKNAKREAKKRAKEIENEASRLEDDEEVGGISVFLVTVVIVLIWLAILCLLVKLDVGGFGSNVLRPLFKDVPVINQILPAENGNLGSEIDQDALGNYSSMEEAVTYIRELELKLEQSTSSSQADEERVLELEKEVERLRTFENSQVEFERIKNEFYEEVIYTDQAPDVEEYMKYYEAIDPESAKELYRQVLEQNQTDEETKAYVETYSAMKPGEAAKIFEAMTDDLDLAADILRAMDTDSRGKIMGKMSPDIAASITKLMEP